MRVLARVADRAVEQLGREAVLRQIVDGAGLLGGEIEIGILQTGQQDHRAVREVRADLRDELESRPPVDAIIDERHIKGALAKFQFGGIIGGGPHDTMRLPLDALEQILRQKEVVAVVLDEEDDGLARRALGAHAGL